MSEITIKEVKTKRDLKKFITFPTKLYKGNPYYVHELIGDELNLFDRKKNGAYEYCKSIEILAYIGKKIVGRISGLINHKYNKKINAKQLRFNHFDVIDDVEVSKKMFDYIKKWGKEEGMTSFDGPIGPTDFDRQGMLFYGYDKIAQNFTIYNYPYYNEHMEKLGFVKDVDWLEYCINIPDKVPERLARVASYVRDRLGYKIVKYKNMKEALPDVYKALDVYNVAYLKLHGCVLMSERQLDHIIKQYIPLANWDYFAVVKDKDDNVVGFGFTMPSISKAIQKGKGHLFPFGFIPILKALKKGNETLDMYLVAVKPELQGLGVNSLLVEEILKTAIKNKVKFAETGPMLEENKEILAQWDIFDDKFIIKRRRCWMKEFD